MRIAYLAQSYPPMISGAAISARQTAEALAGRGHQVLVIAAGERDYPYYIYKDNLTVLRLRSIKNPVRVGQRMILFPRRAIMNALSRFQPDIIHVHDPFQISLIALAYARRNRIPVVFTAHQLPWVVSSYLPKALRPFSEKICWMYARWILGRYASVITPTKTIADIVQRMTGLKPKVISNGLDLQTFHPPLFLDDGSASRRKWNLPLGVPLLLHTGRLDSDKSVDQVIRAASPALRESEAHLIIVGDGCQKQNLIQLCKELGVESHVHFLGFVSVEDGLPEIYRMADIFLCASEVETQGLVLLEAAASGLPIIAVNATCISEIVHDGANGLLVEPGDIETFSDKILVLVHDPQLIHEMSMESRRMASVHDVLNTCMAHERLYFDVTKHAPSRFIVTRKILAQLFIRWKRSKFLLGIK